jgi:hypothetical protein
VRSWQELLGDKWDLSEAEETKFGSHAHELYSAFEVLGEVEFFGRVGEPLPTTEECLRVSSWRDTLTVLNDDGTRYSPNGHLWGPLRRIETLIEKPEAYALWQRAVHKLREYFPEDRTKNLPADLDEIDRDHVSLHLWEYGISLVAEILFAEELEMTYFREQLAWYYAGRFPCGWEGDWPLGKLRVF